MANRREFVQRILIGSCIAGFVGFTHSTSLTLRAAEKQDELPENWRFYECNGEILFPIYAASGGLCATYICYVRRGREVIPIEFTADEVESLGAQDIIMKVHRAIRTRKPRTVNFDGGDLGRAEKES